MVLIGVKQHRAIGQARRDEIHGMRSNLWLDVVSHSEADEQGKVIDGPEAAARLGTDDVVLKILDAVGVAHGALGNEVGGGGNVFVEIGPLESQQLLDIRGVFGIAALLIAPGIELNRETPGSLIEPLISLIGGPALGLSLDLRPLLFDPLLQGSEFFV